MASARAFENAALHTTAEQTSLHKTFTNSTQHLDPTIDR
jgi:hypothetical protein